jgi:hypothetical protein
MAEVIEHGFRGLWLVVRLNSDWFFTIGTVVVGLLAGAFLGSVIAGL